MKRTGRNKSCETCGVLFYVAPARVSQRWCSIACVPSEVRTLGPQHQRKAKPSICAHCDAEFYARPSALELGRKFCSRECFYASGIAQTADARAKRREANRDRSGSSNPNFKNGRNTGRQIRGFTLKLKGESCCRNCGAHGEGIHAIHLHHVIPRSLCKESRDNLLNGIPLCPKCHHGWHRRSVVIYRDIFTPDEWAYLTSVRLSGQNIEAWLDDRYPERPMTCGAAALTPVPSGTVVIRRGQSSREGVRP